MEDEKESFLKECEGKYDARGYMVEDANSECNTNLGMWELIQIANEVLGTES